jgi:hypothetical protein
MLKYLLYIKSFLSASFEKVSKTLSNLSRKIETKKMEVAKPFNNQENTKKMRSSPPGVGNIELNHPNLLQEPSEVIRPQYPFRSFRERVSIVRAKIKGIYNMMLRQASRVELLTYCFYSHPKIIESIEKFLFSFYKICLKI